MLQPTYNCRAASWKTVSAHWLRQILKHTFTPHTQPAMVIYCWLSDAWQGSSIKCTTALHLNPYCDYTSQRAGGDFC